MSKLPPKTVYLSDNGRTLTFHKEYGRGGRYVVHADQTITGGTLAYLQEQIDAYEWVKAPHVDAETEWDYDNSYAMLKLNGHRYATDEEVTWIKATLEKESASKAAVKAATEERERAELARLEKKYRGS